MVSVDYSRKRKRADQKIKKWGGPALIRREGSDDRECTIAIFSYTPRERSADPMIQNVDRRGLMSALAPDGALLVPPDQDEGDYVVLLNKTTLAEIEELSVVSPPGKLDPSSSDVVYWEVQLRHG